MAFRSVPSVRLRRASPRDAAALVLRRVAAAVLIRASRALERLADAVGPAPPTAWSTGTREFVPSPDGCGGALYVDGLLVGRVDGVRRL